MITTLSLARSLGGPWSGFLEYAGEFSSLGRPGHVAHAGVVYLLEYDRQLDFHFGVDMNRTSNRFIAAGYSFRL